MCGNVIILAANQNDKKVTLKKYFSSYWIRSAFYTILQRFSLTIFAAITYMILIRSLSDKTRMGTWALFLTIITIFEATKSGLLKNAHIKYVSSDIESPEKTAIASSSLLINLAINIVFTFLIVFFAGWLSSSLHSGAELAAMLKWYIPGLLCMTLFSHLEAVQQSHFEFKGIFAGYFVRQAAFFIVVVVHFLAKIPFSLSHLAMYQSMSIILGTIVIYISSRKFLLYRFDPTLPWIKKIMGYGGFIFGSGLISNIFSNLDQLMTAAVLKSPSSVAYYNAASRINGFIDVPSYAASEIIFPKLSQASSEEGPGKVRYLYERMVSILLSFTAPTALFIILVPSLVIYIIAGPNYQATAPILQLYMIAGLFNPMQNQAANVLNSIGKPGLCFVMNVVTLAGKLGINYSCLVHFGFYGAAIGQLISSVFTAVIWYFVMRRQIDLHLSSVFKYMLDVYRTLYTQSIGFIQKIRRPTPE
jgi:lipopolysaccharide exporter